LLRARAIENQSFVVAAAQTGQHPGDRRTYGHSMIIGPWGEVLAQSGREEHLLVHRLNLQQQDELRTTFPVLKQRV
jgi:predicted amidohydrolase